MSLTGQAPQPINKKIDNVGFWPALELSDFISEYRIPEQYDNAPLISEIQTAILTVNGSLSSIAALFDEFTDITQKVFEAGASNERDDITHHYQRAVFSEARAQLITLFVTTNRKDSADNAHDQWADTMEYWQCRREQSVYYIIKRLAPEPPPRDVNDTFYDRGNMAAVI